MLLLDFILALILSLQSPEPPIVQVHLDSDLRPTSYYAIDLPQEEPPTPLERCLSAPYRFNWYEYASAYDWPLDQVEKIIITESGGDLCAINSSSGATCWIQQHPGGDAFLDPQTCMSQAYSKWVDGGDHGGDIGADGGQRRFNIDVRVRS